MISKKKSEILKFIQEHGSITIDICSKVIFTGNAYAYDQSRKILRRMHLEDKSIARYKSSLTNEVIYYIDTRLGIHSLMLLKVYAKIIELSCKVTKFEKKYRIYINDKKYREIDALIELYYDDFFIPLIIEIDYSHMTSLEKLQEIYNCNHFQNKYYNEIGESEIFPLTIIARPVVENKLSTENEFPILYSDFHLDNLVMALD